MAHSRSVDVSFLDVDTFPLKPLCPVRLRGRQENLYHIKQRWMALELKPMLHLAHLWLQKGLSAKPRLSFWPSIA